MRGPAQASQEITMLYSFVKQIQWSYFFLGEIPICRYFSTICLKIFVTSQMQKMLVILYSFRYFIVKKLYYSMKFRTATDYSYLRMCKYEVR